MLKEDGDYVPISRKPKKGLQSNFDFETILNGIVNLIIELGRKGKARDQGSHLSALPWIEAII